MLYKTANQTNNQKTKSDKQQKRKTQKVGAGVHRELVFSCFISHYGVKI